MALDVHVEGPSTRWMGKTVDLSPYGVKVALPPNLATVAPGTRLQLALDIADGSPLLSLAASVVRTDRDGIGLNFINLDKLAFERIKNLVDSLLGALSNGSGSPDVPVKPVRERRKSLRADADLDINFEAETPYDWCGKTINLSPYGVKVALPASAIRPSEGTSVKLRLVAPDSGVPISVTGMVWRREPKGMVLLFLEMKAEELERLRGVVDSLRVEPV